MCGISCHMFLHHFESLSSANGICGLIQNSKDRIFSNSPLWDDKNNGKKGKTEGARAKMQSESLCQKQNRIFSTDEPYYFVLICFTK